MKKLLTQCKFVILCSGTLLLGIGNSAWPSDFQSPRTAALGGAGHAGPLLNDAIYLNPSYASLLPTYSIASNYEMYTSGNTYPNGTSDYNGHLLNFSIQDGRSELFQAGVGYTRREDARLINFGASKSVVKRIGVGIGGKFVMPNGNTPSFEDTIISGSGIVLPWLQTSFIVDNLIEGATARQLGFYREFILGTKINVQGIMLIYFDPHLTPTLPTLYGQEAGLEFVIMKDFFLRLGEFKNSQIPFENAHGDGFAIGAGWVGPRTSFDYSLSHAISPLPGLANNFGFTMYF